MISLCKKFRFVEGYPAITQLTQHHPAMRTRCRLQGCGCLSWRIHDIKPGQHILGIFRGRPSWVSEARGISADILAPRTPFSVSMGGTTDSGVLPSMGRRGMRPTACIPAPFLAPSSLIAETSHEGFFTPACSALPKPPDYIHRNILSIHTIVKLCTHGRSAANPNDGEEGGCLKCVVVCY